MSCRSTRSKVIGFVTDLGGKTSHSAILARALEIPAVVGLERVTAEISRWRCPRSSTALTGVVVINPDQETFRDYLQRKQHYEYLERELLKLRDLPAETTDGHRMVLKGNVEFLEEIASLKRHGGEGIGLYRTEMLFFNRQNLPARKSSLRPTRPWSGRWPPTRSPSAPSMWGGTSLSPT